MRLFHAGYLDRPRAQLARFPSSGSAHSIYALADRGIRLLREEDGVEFRNTEWSRKNREAGRPFIEHQIEIVNFQVTLQRAVAQRGDLRLVGADDLIPAATKARAITIPAAVTLRAKLGRAQSHEIRVMPDVVFGLDLAGGARRNFVVEIDRGTMPVRRSDPDDQLRRQDARLSCRTCSEATRAAIRLEEFPRPYGHDRSRPRADYAGGSSAAPHVCSVGPALFSFATFDELRESDPLAYQWVDGTGNATH